MRVHVFRRTKDINTQIFSPPQLSKRYNFHSIRRKKPLFSIGLQKLEKPAERGKGRQYDLTDLSCLRNTKNTTKVIRCTYLKHFQVTLHQNHSIGGPYQFFTCRFLRLQYLIICKNMKAKIKWPFVLQTEMSSVILMKTGKYKTELSFTKQKQGVNHDCTNSFAKLVTL